eukprot:scaffold330_cov109-Isochrysis_galbana.AAC.15
MVPQQPSSSVMVSSSTEGGGPDPEAKAHQADVASACQQAAEAWPRASCADGAAGSRVAAAQVEACLGAACHTASQDEACLEAVEFPGAFRSASQGKNRGVAAVDHHTAADDPATSPGRDGDGRRPRGRPRSRFGAGAAPCRAKKKLLNYTLRETTPSHLPSMD